MTLVRFFSLLLLLCNINCPAISQGKIDIDSVAEAIQLDINRIGATRKSGKVDSSLFYGYRVVNIGRQYGVKDKVAIGYLNLGAIHRQLGQMDSCVYYYDQAFDSAMAIKDSALIASCYNVKGNVAHIGGNFEEAIRYYSKSLEMKRSIGDMKGVCTAYVNVSAIQKEVGDYEAALDGFNKALVLAEEGDWTRLRIFCLIKISGVLRSLDDPDDAVQFADKALRIAIEAGQKGQELTAYYHLGEGYMMGKSYGLAFENQEKALQLSRELRHKAYEAAILTSMAQNYMASATGQGDAESIATEAQIEQLLLDAEQLSVSSGSVDSNTDVLEALIYFYGQSKNYKKLSYYQGKYLLVKDTIFTKDRLAAIGEWETKYNTAEKELMIARLEGDKKLASLRHKILVWAICFLVVAFTLGSVFALKYIRNRNERRRMEEANEFRSNVSRDLHDEVGSLLTAMAMQSEMLAARQKGQDAQMLERLGKLSRTAMQSMRDMVWSIDARKDSIDNLQLKIKEYLSEVVTPTGTEYTFKSNLSTNKGAIAPEVRQNVYLIFKEAITNSLKHSAGSSIVVSLTSDKKSMSLEVKDFGSGIPNDQRNHTGTGMRSMQDRVSKLNGQLTIDRQNGYAIAATIPI